jgi:hypothetical protein
MQCHSIRCITLYRFVAAALNHNLEKQISQKSSLSTDLGSLGRIILQK